MGCQGGGGGGGGRGSEEVPVLKRLDELVQAAVVKVEDFVLRFLRSDDQLTRRLAFVREEETQRSAGGMPA